MHPVLADNVYFYLTEEGDYLMESPNKDTYVIGEDLYTALEALANPSCILQI